MSKTTANGTTQYLVDDENPTGYAQVMDEVQSSAATRTYTWGLDLVSERQTLNSTLTTSYYVFDGHGSVRALTNAAGAVTDSYDYDAFGILTHSTGTTPNNYLSAGEQYDPDLNLYYNRARYLNTSTGRFWTMDSLEGQSPDPLSLHKYVFAEANPVEYVDRSGNQIDDVAIAATEGETVDAMTTEQELQQTILTEPPPTAAPPPASVPPPTIPGTPVPVSYGSVIGRAIVYLTALGLVTSLASDNPVPPTQPRAGDDESLAVYRDAGGPSPSDFNPSTTAFSTTGWGLSLLQQPQRNKQWIVPFTVTYRRPLETGTIGVYRGELALGLAHTGNFGEAARVLGAAKYSQEKAEYWLRLAEHQFQIGEPDSARDSLRHCDEDINLLQEDLIAERAHVLAEKAKLLDRFGLPEEALGAWNGAIKLAQNGQEANPNSSDCTAQLVTIVSVLTDLKRLDLARSVADSITSRFPSRREHAYKLINEASSRK